MTEKEELESKTLVIGEEQVFGVRKKTFPVPSDSEIAPTVVADAVKEENPIPPNEATQELFEALDVKKPVEVIERAEDFAALEDEVPADKATVGTESPERSKKAPMLSRKELIRQAKKNMKVLEHDLAEEKSQLEDMQNLVSEYIFKAETRMNNLIALVENQKELLADYLGEERTEAKEEIPTHQRPDRKWWKRG